MLSGLKQQAGGEKLDFADAGWLSDKDNPYIRENVEMYDKGGKANIVAEFTGNELIVNNQDAVEKGIAVGNYAMAAAPIKKAMKDKNITPGPETHKNNPMPVDSKGNIYYEGGGKLSFKVKKIAQKRVLVVRNRNIWFKKALKLKRGNDILETVLLSIHFELFYLFNKLIFS